MSKMFLILFLVFGLCAMAGETAGQQIYKWVDEKGTVHFSDSPTAEVVKPQGQQTSKERTLEVVTGVEAKEPSKEELLIEYLKRRDREQESIRQAEQERQERMFKTIRDQQEELQRAADKFEKDSRKGYSKSRSSSDRATQAENKARRAERDAEDAQRKARNAERRARDADWERRR